MFSPNGNSTKREKTLFVAVAIIALVLWGVIIFSRWGGNIGAPRKAYVVGIVSLGGVIYAEPITGLKEGMETLGYKEGEKITYRVVDTAGSLEKAREAANEFLRENVDAVYSLSTPVTRQVKEVVRDIPVIFNIVADPVTSGFAKSLRSSGTNLTGCSVGQFAAKRLEILKSLLPNARKVLVVYDPQNPYSQQSISLLREAATVFDAILTEKHIKTREDLAKIMNETSIGQYDAFLNFGEVKVTSAINIVVERANAIKLPTVGPATNAVREGMLIGYGPSWIEMGKQCASVMDKILRGVKPSDIPIQSPAQAELSVNMKTARQIGVTFPQEQLIRVDTFIE